ncbi:MAG: hypothetical protein V1721_07980 [Pseudomonadota bacterium]
MSIRLSPFVISAFLLSFCSAGSAAFADGMPFGNGKPQPILTTLDKALDDIQGREQFPAPAPEEDPVSAPPRKAGIPPAPESRIVEVQSGTSFFGLSVGMYDPFTHAEKASSFNLEWQPGVRIAGVLQPIFGAVAATNGSLLGYGGIGVPFNITDRVFMLPSIAVGAYKKGDGYDLDGSLAFRIGTELAYRFDDKSRIGLNMHILTNGTSLGRGDRTEIIGIAYTMPFEAFSKPAAETIESASPPKNPPQE